MNRRGFLGAFTAAGIFGKNTINKATESLLAEQQKLKSLGKMAQGYSEDKMFSSSTEAISDYDPVEDLKQSIWKLAHPSDHLQRIENIEASLETSQANILSLKSVSFSHKSRMARIQAREIEKKKELIRYDKQLQNILTGKNRWED